VANLSESRSAELVVQRQLDAYNARDVEALLATYASDAQQFEHPGKLLASGHEEIRGRMAIRFLDPNLHATLIQRTVIGDVVIDHEIVTSSVPEGQQNVELIVIYQVMSALIRTAAFILGATVPDSEN
jgi:hypothetical protein